jgi:hypothetical protein
MSFEEFPRPGPAFRGEPEVVGVVWSGWGSGKDYLI